MRGSSNKGRDGAHGGLGPPAEGVSTRECRHYSTGALQPRTAARTAARSTLGTQVGTAHPPGSSRST